MPRSKSTTVAYPSILIKQTPNLSLLFGFLLRFHIHGLFQRFLRPELYHPGGRNLDRFTGSRVPANPGSAIRHRKGSEANQDNLTAGLKVLLNSFNYGIHRSGGFSLGESNVFCDLSGQFTFDIVFPLVAGRVIFSSS